jgi:hypothetical protein
MKICRYELEITDRLQVITMPAGAQLLSVQPRVPFPLGGRQSTHLWVWALVHPELPLASREFLIVGTGHPCNVNFYSYLGTCMMPNELAWHVFHRSI